MVEKNHLIQRNTVQIVMNETDKVILVDIQQSGPKSNHILIPNPSPCPGSDLIFEYNILENVNIKYVKYVKY